MKKQKPERVLKLLDSIRKDLMFMAYFPLKHRKQEPLFKGDSFYKQLQHKLNELASLGFPYYVMKLSKYKNKSNKSNK